MISDELQAALDELSTNRIQRLVDRLETNWHIHVTVGACKTGCPMLLAGFDSFRTDEEAPERRFELAWEHCAMPGSTTRWKNQFTPGPQRTAASRDVQALLRMANTTLARRAAPWLTSTGPEQDAHVPGDQR